MSDKKPNPESIITQVKDSDEEAKIKHLEQVINKKKKKKPAYKCLLCCFKSDADSSTGTKISEIITNDDKLRKSPGSTNGLIAPPTWNYLNKICLVVDLDETLVHSTFKVVANPDYIIPVEIDSHVYSVYVLKRPHVDNFIEEIGKLFECILFTASLAKYAEPLSNLLDKKGIFQYRLYREACIFKKGVYIKDLQNLGRPLDKLALLDNSPTSYMNQPNNGIPIKSWFGDMADTELLKLLPHLKKLSTCTNVYACLPTIHRARFASGEYTSTSEGSSDPIQTGGPTDLDIKSFPSPSPSPSPIVATTATTNKNKNNNDNNNEVIDSLSTFQSSGDRNFDKNFNVFNERSSQKNFNSITTTSVRFPDQQRHQQQLDFTEVSADLDNIFSISKFHNERIENAGEDFLMFLKNQDYPSDKYENAGLKSNCSYSIYETGNSSNFSKAKDNNDKINVNSKNQHENNDLKKNQYQQKHQQQQDLQSSLKIKQQQQQQQNQSLGNQSHSIVSTKLKNSRKMFFQQSPMRKNSQKSALEGGLQCQKYQQQQQYVQQQQQYVQQQNQQQKLQQQQQNLRQQQQHFQNPPLLQHHFKRNQQDHRSSHQNKEKRIILPTTTTTTKTTTTSIDDKLIDNFNGLSISLFEVDKKANNNNINNNNNLRNNNNNINNNKNNNNSNNNKNSIIKNNNLRTNNKTYGKTNLIIKSNEKITNFNGKFFQNNISLLKSNASFNISDNVLNSGCCVDDNFNVGVDYDDDSKNNGDDDDDDDDSKNNNYLLLPNKINISRTY